MKKLSLLGTSALRSAPAIILALSAASPLYAQTDSGTPPEVLAGEQELESGQNATQGEEILVTGSRIRSPGLTSNVPVTAIGGEEIFEQGQTSIGDLLNELPALRSTFGQQNSGRFLGTTGLNLLDLRGLGPQRTLVLVNGRRHVAADILSNGVSPDVNTIPSDLLERVDVVTGGNSAIYGSDALAGVVNFILKRDFEGVQARGQAGVTGYGAGGNQYGSIMAGKNFGGGRGNIVAHAEYAHQERLFGSDVPHLRQNNGFVAIDSDPAGTPNGSDGIPDSVFMRDIRATSISSNTLINFAQGAGAPCGRGFNNTPYNCLFQFNPEGTALSAVTGTRVGTGPLGSLLGGTAPTNREGPLLTVLPFQERMNANILAHYTVSDAFEPFIEAKFVRVNTQGQNSSPAFIQGSSIDANRERIRLDNPYLTPALRTQIANQILASGIRPNTSTQVALTDADRAAIAAGTYRFPIQRYLLDLGVRDERSQRDTYRIVGGARGTFNDDWSYEVSANYGRFDEKTTVLGNINQQRFLLAIDSGINPATGQIACRAQFDPAARIDVIGTDRSAELLASDISACIPYNPFGAGAGNDAARGYIVQDTESVGTLEQLVFSGYVSGDTSQWFELPGGPVGFAIGAEYRREDAFFQADPLVEQGFTFYNALPTFDPPSFEVKEAFAEVRLPLLSGTPFFEDLAVTAAGRVADYKGGAGTVFAYNAGLEWQPIEDVRFRANYGRSVRAPNVAETASPLGQNFAPGFQDPCRPANIGTGTQYRAANCAADLGPLLAGFDLPNYSLELLSGSNPELNEETSDSYTVGAVVTPSFAPGLSITVDYYDITVNDVISSPSAQTIVNTCYDLPDRNNQFCALFERFRGPGNGPADEIPGEILATSLEVIPLNYAALKVRGIDTEIAYRKSIGANSRIDTRFIYTHQLKNSAYTNPADPNFENRILGELGDPQDEFQWDVDLTLNQLTIGYQMRYLDSMVIGAWEDQNVLQGRPAQNADAADILSYPETFYHDVRLAVNLDDAYSFYAGIDNVLNTVPPLGATGTAAGSAIYNARGRNFFAGFRARF